MSNIGEEHSTYGRIRNKDLGAIQSSADWTEFRNEHNIDAPFSNFPKDIEIGDYITLPTINNHIPDRCFVADIDFYSHTITFVTKTKGIKYCSTYSNYNYAFVYSDMYTYLATELSPLLYNIFNNKITNYKREAFSYNISPNIISKNGYYGITNCAEQSRDMYTRPLSLIDIGFGYLSTNISHTNIQHRHLPLYQLCGLDKLVNLWLYGWLEDFSYVQNNTNWFYHIGSDGKIYYDMPNSQHPALIKFQVS